MLVNQLSVSKFAVSTVRANLNFVVPDEIVAEVLSGIFQHCTASFSQFDSGIHSVDNALRSTTVLSTYNKNRSHFVSQCVCVSVYYSSLC